MTAHAFHGYIDGVDGCVVVACGDADFASLNLCIIVQSDRVSRFAKTIVEAGVQHRARASHHFFCRLADEYDRAMPFVL